MTPKQSYPVPGATASFWRSQPHKLDSHRSTPELPAEADVVIVGAGFAGASLAHYIYEDNPSPPSVVILEAREACSGATARNGGHLKPDVYFNVAKHVKKYGAKAAAEVARFEASQVYAVKDLVEKENIDCDFTLTRACDATMDPKLARETEEAFDLLVKEGITDFKDVYRSKAHDAEKLSGVKGALSCFTFTAGNVWPYKLVMHLLASAVSKGVNLQTHTPVTSISDQPLRDGRWRVHTARGSILARKLLLATNGYTQAIAPQFANHIVPVRGICSRITVPSGTPRPFLPYTYSIRHGAGVYDYLISRADGSIIVGGAKPTFWSDRRQWYDNVDDSTLIEPARHYFDGLMQRTFAGWEDSGAKTDQVWTGIMGWSNDWMPYVGHVPGKPGQMILGGFSGHGMPLILLSAKGVVKMLREGVSLEEAGVPGVFAATEGRLKSERNEILEDPKGGTARESKL